MPSPVINPLFLGVTRFQNPLPESTRKKFEALSRIGTISVVAFSGRFRFRRFTEAATFYLLPNVPRGICSYACLCTVGLVVSAYLLMNRRANVVVAQSAYEGFVAAVVVAIARIFGRPAALVVESHGDFENAVFLYRRTLRTRAHRAVLKYVADFSIQRAHALRSVSVLTGNQLKPGDSDKPMFQFPAWTDLDLFLEAFGERSPDTSVRLLFVGVLAPIKGLQDLLKAFKLVAAELDNATLSIVGEPRTRTYLNELRKLTRQLNLEKRVEFRGYQPQTEVANYMRRAAVLVVPSLSEGFPRIVLEGIAAGVPVVATNVGGIPELIADGVTGFLVEPGNHRMLADAIVRVIKNSSKATVIARQARARAVEVFSKEKYVASYRELLGCALRAV
jgi:glycosyltransferase involved in cell wall biosynthesis